MFSVNSFTGTWGDRTRLWFKFCYCEKRINGTTEFWYWNKGEFSHRGTFTEANASCGELWALSRNQLSISHKCFQKTHICYFRRLKFHFLIRVEKACRSECGSCKLVVHPLATPAPVSWLLAISFGHQYSSESKFLDIVVLFQVQLMGKVLFRLFRL